MNQSSDLQDEITALLREELKVYEELDYRECEKSLYEFVRSSFHVLEPGKKFIDGWHIGYLCEKLEQVSSGDCRRLIINIPPRHMKSLEVTICWPVWTWCNFPESRWMFSSYSADLSTDHSRKRRYLIKSEWFQKRWASRFRLSEDQDRQQVIENNRRGAFIATSVGGTAAGKGGDFCIADDPQDPQRGASKADREAGNNHVSYLFNTRLDDPRTGRFVLVQQRIHHDDATAHLLKMEKEAPMEVRELIGTSDHVCLGAISKKTYSIVYPKSLKVKEIKEGDVLWAEQFDKGSLASIKVGLGSLHYAAQYDQEPTPPGGYMVKREYWKRYKELTQATFRLWSFDTAIAEGEENDYTVGGLIRQHNDGWEIEKVVRKKLEAVELEKFIEDLYAAYPSDLVLIEDKSSGQRVIQYFRKEKKIPAIAFKPSQYGDKVQRLSRIVPTIEAKKVAIPDTSVLQAPWVADFLEEIEEFPRGSHDDQVDMISQALLYLIFETSVGSFPSESSVESKPMMPSLNSGQIW